MGAEGVGAVEMGSGRSIVERLRFLLTVLSAGGVEGLEKQIEEEAVAKKKEDERRQRISTKTRNRLTQLLSQLLTAASGRSKHSFN